jgi:bifunctional UDP-N-acetylglucosamine pyrophosphorylase/glucosamine-1-phosphate N-acetyltransferase
MQAVILAAGKGTRMGPLTENKPKVMIPVGNKPFLEILIGNLKDAGIKDIILVTNYKKEAIENHFNDSVKYVVQKEPLGTAHALKEVENLIKDKFLVIMGDNLISKEDVRNLVKMENVVSIVESENPSSYGVVETNNGKVRDIIEKPSNPKTNFINSGVYVFDRDIFKAIKNTKKSKRNEYELTDSIKLLIKEGREFKIHKLKEWLDLGNPSDILTLNELFLKKIKGENKGKIEEGVTIKGEVVIGKGSVIKSGGYIEGPVSIGENCKIGPNCYVRAYTSIGNNCVVGNAVEIKNSVIMDNTKICHLSYVGDSVIGEDCNFGAGTKIANLRLDNKNVKLKINGKLVDTKRKKFGAVVGDNVKTGLDVKINPGRVIDSNTSIMPGRIV